MNKKLKKACAAALCAVAVAPCLITAGCGSSALDWAVKTAREKYYYELPEKIICDGTPKDFAEKYLDKYSEYYTKEEVKQVESSNAGNKSGVGISQYYLPEGYHPQKKSGVFIRRVVGNSPAYFSGMQAGEVLTGGLAGESEVAFSSSADFVNFIEERKTGEKFLLYCDVHEGGHELAKANYTASYCTMSTATATYDVVYNGSSGGVIETQKGKSCLPDGAAYLRIDQFYGNAAKELALLIEVYNSLHCTSLILDLRDNGGGYVNVMQDMADAFIGGLSNAYSAVMYAEYKGGFREAYYNTGKLEEGQRLAPGTKVSLLADNGTASAAEALAGVLIDNGVLSYKDVYISNFAEGYLAATQTHEKNCKTYGKGIMQTTFKNRLTGAAIKLTTAKVFWPKGETCIHDIGLSRDMGCNTLKADWNVTYNDEELALAVEKIYGSKAQESTNY